MMRYYICEHHHRRRKVFEIGQARDNIYILVRPRRPQHLPRGGNKRTGGRGVLTV